jgi:hypothetical protein
MSMFKNLFLFCLFLAISAGSVWSGDPLDDVDLGKYRWKNRLMFLFSPSPEVPDFQTLSGELNRHSDGVRERDLLIFRVLEQAPSSPDSQEITTSEAKSLRRRFGITPGNFTVVLVGKDGTVKLKRQGPTALKDIFGLIDSMPMRRREMQGK